MMPAPSVEERHGHEIAHYRDLAAQDTEAILGWQSPAGRARADRRGRLFLGRGRIGPGARVLELGCGTGEFTRRVVPAGARVVALDLSGDLLAKARAKIGAAARFVRASAHVLPFADASFDVVYGCSVLHHLDVEVALREVRRVLRPGGRLVFSEPNLVNPQVFLMFKVARLKPHYGVSPDEMAFTRRAISRVLRAIGFSRFEVTNFDFVHPGIPGALLPVLEPVLERLERVPVVRALSGSMLIHAER
jgi:SAM-dependent methyltransferase